MMREPLEYLDCDFYSIEEINGEKYVHMYGYCYYADSELEEGKPYRLVELTFCLIPLRKFPMTEVDIVEWQSNVRQYITDMDEKECAKTIEGYAENVTELPYSQLTLDTPTGNYINY